MAGMRRTGDDRFENVLSSHGRSDGATGMPNLVEHSREGPPPSAVAWPQLLTAQAVERPSRAERLENPSSRIRSDEVCWCLYPYSLRRSALRPADRIPTCQGATGIPGALPSPV